MDQRENWYYKEVPDHQTVFESLICVDFKYIWVHFKLTAFTVNFVSLLQFLLNFWLFLQDAMVVQCMVIPCVSLLVCLSLRLSVHPSI